MSGPVFYCPSCKTIKPYINERECADCVGESKASETIEGPEILVKDKFIDIKAPGVNLARGKRTVAQQERVYGRMMENARKQVQRKKRAMRTQKKSDDDMNLVAKIPRELHIARTRQFGKRYWEDEGRSALKRDGLLLDD